MASTRTVSIGGCGCCGGETLCCTTKSGDPISAGATAPGCGLEAAGINDGLDVAVFGNSGVGIGSPVASTSDLGVTVTITGAATAETNGVTFSGDCARYEGVILYADKSSGPITIEFGDERTVCYAIVGVAAGNPDTYPTTAEAWDSNGNYFVNTGEFFDCPTFTDTCGATGFFARAAFGFSLTKMRFMYTGKGTTFDANGIGIGSIGICSEPAPAASRLITHDGDFLVDHDGNYLVIGA